LNPNDTLTDLNRRAELGGGDERLRRQHEAGKLTARERMELLFDAGSFEELDKLVVHRCRDFGMADQLVPGDGVVAGHGLVDGRQVFAFAQDFTVFGGSLLASVADIGTGRIAFGMAVFGLTMAAPFVFLALLPGRVKALPKSGEWMNTLKVSLGFVELAAALKFLSNVDVALGLQWMPREAFLMTWAFIFVLLALFLLGLLGHRAVPVEGVSGRRNGSGVLSLAFAFYCMYGAMGFALDPIMTAFEPPYRLAAHDEHPIVDDDHQAAMQQGRAEERWVLVNFTGFT
jgi:hypothetical protein